MFTDMFTDMFTEISIAWESKLSVDQCACEFSNVHETENGSSDILLNNMFVWLMVPSSNQSTQTFFSNWMMSNLDNWAVACLQVWWDTGKTEGGQLSE